MARSSPRRKPRNTKLVNEAEAYSHRLFQEAAQKQRVCIMCGSGRRADWHPHHVVYAQWLRDNGFPVYDTRNVLRICPDCHAAHHDRSKPIPLTKLRDENIEYAFLLMGAYAFHYLTARYAGEDPRLELALAAAESATVV